MTHTGMKRCASCRRFKHNRQFSADRTGRNCNACAGKRRDRNRADESRRTHPVTDCLGCGFRFPDANATSLACPRCGSLDRETYPMAHYVALQTQEDLA